MQEKGNQVMIKILLIRRAEFLNAIEVHIVRTALMRVAAVMKTNIIAGDVAIVRKTVTTEESTKEREVTVQTKRTVTKEVNAGIVCVQVTVQMREIPVQMKTVRMSRDPDMIQDDTSPIIIGIQIAVREIQVALMAIMKGRDHVNRSTQKRPFLTEKI